MTDLLPSVGSGLPEGESALTAQDARNLGRGYLADQIEAARAAGVDASGWMPPVPGLDGLAIAVVRFRPQLAVGPASMRQRTLRERIRTHRPTGTSSIPWQAGNASPPGCSSPPRPSITT